MPKATPCRVAVEGVLNRGLLQGRRGLLVRPVAGPGWAAPLLPPRLESKRRFTGLAAKPSPLSAPAQRELRRALTASADSRASCQLSNSHEKAGPLNSQQFATPCSLKIMELPGTQTPPLLKDIGGLLTLALLQQVPRCQNPFPAIDTSARVLPLPRARRQCPTAGETADTHPIYDRRCPSDSRPACHHEDIELFWSAPPACRSGPGTSKRLRPRHTRLDGPGQQG